MSSLQERIESFMMRVLTQEEMESGNHLLRLIYDVPNDVIEAKKDQQNEETRMRIANKMANGVRDSDYKAEHEIRFEYDDEGNHCMILQSKMNYESQESK